MLSAVDLAGARDRLEPVHAALAVCKLAVFVTIGLAQMSPADTIGSLVARADADLYRQHGAPA